MAPAATTPQKSNIDADFLDIPAFPNDVPTAPLLRLSLSALRSDPEEAEALFKASKDLGFFYLDMRGDELGEHLLAESDKLFGVGKELFAEGAEKLMNYDYSKGEKNEDGTWKEGRAPTYMGYKHVGKGVTDAQGNRDRNEFYNVSFPTPRMYCMRTVSEIWEGCSQLMTRKISWFYVSNCELPSLESGTVRIQKSSSVSQVRVDIDIRVTDRSRPPRMTCLTCRQTRTLTLSHSRRTRPPWHFMHAMPTRSLHSS